MGLIISNVFRQLLGKQQVRILMVGLDSAGKTTILYKLKMGEVINTIPTIGFNVETVEYKNISFLVWDVGGQNKLRALWRHYYENTQGLIYVVDSSDRERINDVKIVLHNILLEDSLTGAVLLIIANKQDQVNAMSCTEIRDKLELFRLKNRKWIVQGCSAVNGHGLFEGLDWLSNEIIKNKSMWK